MYPDVLFHLRQFIPVAFRVNALKNPNLCFALTGRQMDNSSSWKVQYSLKIYLNLRNMISKWDFLYAWHFSSVIFFFIKFFGGKYGISNIQLYILFPERGFRNWQHLGLMLWTIIISQWIVECKTLHRSRRKKFRKVLRKHIPLVVFTWHKECPLKCGSF